MISFLLHIRRYINEVNAIGQFLNKSIYFTKQGVLAREVKQAQSETKKK